MDSRPEVWAYALISVPFGGSCLDVICYLSFCRTPRSSLLRSTACLTVGTGQPAWTALSPSVCPSGLVSPPASRRPPAGRSARMASSLDSYKNKRNRHCGYMTVSGTVDHDGKKHIAYARMYCKKWNCPDCGPRLAKKLQRNIAHAAREHNLDRLLTLTLDPRRIKTADPIGHIWKTWQKFRVYLQRKFKESITYVAVMELHKSGLPHLHILIDRFIPQAWISDRWERLGGGRVVDVRRINNLDNAAWYLSKYLSKDALRRVPKGKRRYSKSRNVRFPKRELEGNWHLSRANLDNIYNLRKDAASNVIEAPDGRVHSFLVPLPVDLSAYDLPTDRFWSDLSSVEMPEGFASDEWELVAYWETDDHENSGDIRSGIEQGTAAGRVLDSGSAEVA